MPETRRDDVDLARSNLKVADIVKRKIGGDGKVTKATNGGSEGKNFRLQRAAWAVAIV